MLDFARVIIFYIVLHQLIAYVDARLLCYYLATNNVFFELFPGKLMLI